MKSARTIKLDDIKIDGGTQIREVISQETVYKYKEDMEEGDQFPPIETVFDGTTYWLTDGFHRYHAMKILGQRTVDVLYQPGTLQDAQVIALGANARHGLPRSNADKRRAVLRALELDMTRNMSDAEIARICKVSGPFVAGIRRPEAKERQQEAIKRHVEKRKETKLITPEKSDVSTGEAPDESELRATQLAHDADIETMHKLLEADEPLKVAHEEIQRLTHLNAQLEVRLQGVMAEKNEAVKMVKKLQKQLDNFKKEK